MAPDFSDRPHVLVAGSDLPRPGQFAAIAFALLATLIVLSSIGVALVGQGSSPLVSTFHRAVYVDHERNLTTFFNFSLMTVNVVLLAMATSRAARTGSSRRWHWLILGATFLLLSFDEAAQLHERLNAPVKAALDLDGPFAFAWVVPGIAFVATFAATFVRFLRSLPPPVALRMVLGGAVYVGGAIGAEMVGAAIGADDVAQRATIGYVAATTTEEAMEMSGLILFASALLAHLRGPAGRSG